MKSRQDAWTEENDLLLAETVLRHVREGSTQLNAFEEVGDKLNRTSAACGFRWNAVVRHQYEKALQLAKKQRKQRHRILGKEQSGKKKLLYQPPTPSIDELDAMSLSMSKMQEMDEDPTAFILDHNQETEAQPSTETEDSNESQEVSFEQVPMMQQQQQVQQQPVSQKPISTEMRGDMSLEKVILFLQNLAQSGYKTDILRSENQRLRHENAEIRRQNQELEKRIQKLESNSTTMQEDYETLMNIMNRARKLALFEDEEAKAPRFKMDRNGNLEKLAE